MRWFVASLLSLSIATVGCTDDDGITDAASLQAALMAAAPGDEVCVGAGRFDGEFVVPPGVTLCGAGVGVTTIVGPSDRPTIQLQPGATFATGVRDVTIEAAMDGAIVGRGAGAVDVTDVEIRIPTAGVGVGFEGVDAVAMTNVDVQGPVTPGNAGTMPLDPQLSDSATHGVVFVNVVSATMDSVDVDGFAYVGAMYVSSDVTMTGGSISNVLGTGMLVYGGNVDMTGTTLTAALQGSRLLPAYNGVFTGSATISSTGIETSASEGYGFLHADSVGVHVDLTANSNARAGLWVQDATGIEVRGGTMDDNAFAGFAAVDSQNLLLDNVQISNTRLMSRVVGPSRIEVGDGIHLLRTTSGVDMSMVDLNENARVGLLLDTGSSPFDATGIESVSVTGSGTQLGAIGQGTMLPAGWDANITRAGATVSNDAAFAGILDTADGIVGPSDIPVVTEVLATGLDAIVGPSD